MYRYDAFDQRIVDERVAQFRDQTRRYLAGALTEDEFRPLRLQNGLYIQKHAPMLRVAIPYGHAVVAAVARPGAHRAAPTTAATATSRRARTSSSTGRSSKRCPTSSRSWRASRCTRSRPVGQLRAQHHDRPLRRRRRRRDRRSAPLCRADPAMVDVASGVRVPAAQVQDRDHRRDPGPCRDPRPRHRAAARAATRPGTWASASSSAAASAARRSSGT